MRRGNLLQRIGALLLCTIILLGNVPEVHAAETEPEDPPAGELSFTYYDMYGQDGEALFSLTVEPEIPAVGEEVLLSVDYSGNFGWTAEVTTESAELPFEMNSESISFEMPEENVSIVFRELEEYDKGELSGEDSALGEDVGKDHGVTTSKAYEPDISLGKSARWTDIEKGLAELTLTEKDTSDWSDNPSDYIIVLDRTRTMAIDDTCAWPDFSPGLGGENSVCLNPAHYYYYRNQAVRLIDYKNGQYINSGESFHISSGSTTKLWNQHLNSSGDRITPSLANGCYDRLTLAQNSIRSIMDVLDSQNKNELAGGKKNRVMYWSFSGPTFADMEVHPDGLWNEVPEFTTDISAAKNSLRYESYAGTYYNNSFERILEKLQEKQRDPEYQNIPTKVIFVSDGLQSDENKQYTSQLASRIKAQPNTKIYTILIGNDGGSAAGQLLQSYATDPGCFATVSYNWNTFVNTITAIQKDQFEIGAVEKILTDKIDIRYWEAAGSPVLTDENGSAQLDPSGSVLTWRIPTGEGKTYTCKLKLKLKDEYRYLLSDTFYPTNADEEDADEVLIQNDPEKAGAVLSYKIKGGKYDKESRKVGVQTPELKYGTVQVSGTKHWTVTGSSAERLKVSLKRTMPGSTVAVEVNNTTTNVTKHWGYTFTVRQMPDGTTYPLIKYNNAGNEIAYQITETVPEHYVQIHKTEKKENGKLIFDLYNEPYKIKAQLTKADEETKNPLSGAEFTVYTWSKKEKAYVPYRGTTDFGTVPCEMGTMNGAEKAVRLKETEKGIYVTPVWLYYSDDNEGKYRIIETRAPEGYFGDWKEKEKVGQDSSETDKNVYDFQISGDVTKNKETILISNAEDGTFTDQRVIAKLEFSKNDLETKDRIPQAEAVLAGAEYELYAAEAIVHQDGTTGVLHEQDAKIPLRHTGFQNGVSIYCYDPDGTDTLLIDSNDRIRIENLELGKYYLKEKKAGEGYLIDPSHYLVDLSYQGEKIETVTIEDYKVYEQVKKQSLSFYKVTGTDRTDRLDPLEDAKFSIYLVSELADGKYKEVPDEELVQKIIDEFRDPTSLDYRELRKYSPAVIYEESDSADVTEGRLVKRVTYQDGTCQEAPEKENAYLAAELESDERGIVRTPQLPYGRYLIVETTVPENKIATRPFVVNVTGDDEDQTVDGDGLGETLDDLVILMDRPVKALIRIRKADSLSSRTVLKEGAAYLIRDIEGAWFDYITAEMTTDQKKAYKEIYGDLVVQYSQGTYLGTEENPFVTKKMSSDTDDVTDVYIETPKELPAGLYELEEIQAPEGYVRQGYEGVIAKKEGLSGNETFYETETDGQWKETPQGKTRFLVSSSEASYDRKIGSFVVDVRQKNEPAVGKISIYAEGEVLTDAKQEGSTFLTQLLEKITEFFKSFSKEPSVEKEMTAQELDEFKDYVFIYEMEPMEGAEFEIRAAEDIYSQEGEGHAEKLFEKGALVMTLISDENGKTWTGQEDWEGTDIAKGLPLGTYTVTQTKTAEGFYLSEEDQKPREVKISYAGQEVPVIYRDTSYSNPRQQVKLEVKKTDAQTRATLAGAYFGLYAAEDICNEKGRILAKKDTLLSVTKTVLTDNNEIENAVFSPDFPLGNYYVKELKAPLGYQINPENFTVEAGYAGAAVKVLKKTIEVQDQKLPVKEQEPVERYDAPKPVSAPDTSDPGSMTVLMLCLMLSFAGSVGVFVRKHRKY